jgi:CRP-like cAMP-binding protein
MAKARTSLRSRGPTIRALDPWAHSAGRTHQLLTDDECARLAVMSSIVRFQKREIIYLEGAPAEAVFNINTGVVGAYKVTSGGREHITAFLLADDLFGLSAEGKYANSAKAITTVTAYRLASNTLRRRLSNDAELEFHVICKLCQELRQAQHHALLLSEKRAVTKLAMFLQLIEQLQIAKGQQIAEIYLPMDRSDIGEYIGMTLEAVSRAFQALAAWGVIKLRDRGHVRIVDRDAFDQIAGDPPAPPATGASLIGDDR